MGSPSPEKKQSPEQWKNQSRASFKDGYSFIRKGSGLIQNFMNGNLCMETLTHGTSAKTIKAALLTVERGALSDNTEIYLGEKWYYVLEGKLEMLVNEVTYQLEQGDSIYLEPMAVHTWRNASLGKTRALVFSSPCRLDAEPD